MTALEKNLAETIRINDDFTVSIGLTLENAVELMKLINKESEKDVETEGRTWTCPTCGESLDFNHKQVGRCSCGQKLRWME